MAVVRPDNRAAGAPAAASPRRRAALPSGAGRRGRAVPVEARRGARAPRPARPGRDGRAGRVPGRPPVVDRADLPAHPLPRDRHRCHLDRRRPSPTGSCASCPTWRSRSTSGGVRRSCSAAPWSWSASCGPATCRPGFVGAGAGVPGPVSFREGVPVSPPIMPGWNHFPVRETLAAELGCPVLVDNDVNIMALGEKHAGLARSVDDFLFVKIGTGIGCGIVVAGEVYRGVSGSAGDIGHIRVDDNGPDLPVRQHRLPGGVLRRHRARPRRARRRPLRALRGARPHARPGRHAHRGGRRRRGSRG